MNGNIWFIIPVYNRKKPINDLLECIKKQTYKYYHVIIVDHGQTPVFDKYEWKINEDRLFVFCNENSNAKITRIRDLPKSFHWTASINNGIKYLQSKQNLTSDDYIMFNNDDTIFDNTYLQAMMDYANNYKRTIIGSICAESDSDKILYANLPLNKVKATFEYPYFGDKISNLPNKILYSDVLKGRNAMYPAIVFKDIGLLAEKKLPQNRADHEISFRARKFGYKIVIAANAIIYTKLDTQVDIDKNNIIKSAINVLLDKKSHRNIKELFLFSFLCFKPFYALYYFLVNMVRIIFYILIKSLVLPGNVWKS